MPRFSILLLLALSALVSSCSCYTRQNGKSDQQEEITRLNSTIDCLQGKISELEEQKPRISHQRFGRRPRIRHYLPEQRAGLLIPSDCCSVPPGEWNRRNIWNKPGQQFPGITRHIAAPGRLFCSTCSGCSTQGVERNRKSAHDSVDQSMR